IDQVSAAGLIITVTLLKKKAKHFATLFEYDEDFLQWSNS
ncbi:1664_t:CDS:1, partial [Acaulospora morrowiae]